MGPKIEWEVSYATELGTKIKQGKKGEVERIRVP